MIHQAGYFSPVPRIYTYRSSNLLMILPGRQFGDDVVVVSVSTLERSGSWNKRSKQEPQHDVEPNVETPIGMQEPSSTYQIRPHAAQRPGTGRVKCQVCAVPGFFPLTSRFSCTRSFTLYCGHAFGPAVSEASNFMTNRHGRTRPFETVAPDPEQTSVSASRLGVYALA